MKRTDIDEQYKWNISSIYSNKEDFLKDYNEVKEELGKIEKYEKSFLESPENFLEFMIFIENINRKLEKMYTYSHLSVDVEPENDEKQYLNSLVLALSEEYENKTIFVTLEILKNPEKALKNVNTEKTKKYTNFIKLILRNKPHMASDEVEKVLAEASGVLGASYKTYSTLRLDFKPVVIDGEEKFLNEETSREYLKNKDEKVRKQTYENLYTEYKKFANVFASTLEGTIKKDVFYSKVKKFSSPLEASVFNDEVETDLFYKVLEMANNKYHKYFLDYLDVSKKILGKEVLEVYDLRLPLAKPTFKEYSIDDAFDLIFEATKNFGQEYREILEKARKERWIDYMPHEGKRSGAYSSGCFDTNQFILTNFTNDIESVFALIHELGHSVHSYLSNHNQEYVNSDYRIFVAEVASTVNENLLMELLLKNAKTKQEKAYLLYKKLDEFIGCNYRQPFFANFENILHEKVLNNEGLSNQTITDLYEKLSEEYYGGKVRINYLTKYSCYAVPHFYYDYYVYKYTVGMSVASTLAKRIASGDKEQIEKYLNFLKSGSIKSPVELLSDAGVNPTEDKVYEEAFENFRKDLEEFKKIME